MRAFATLSLILATATNGWGAPAAIYAVAKEATPVLNRAAIPSALAERDGCGQVRALEFVALPGTVFSVSGELQAGGVTVYRVSSDDYPYPSAGGYFVDSRSVRLEADRPGERWRALPAKAEIVAAMKRRVGTGYVWGGNVAGGVAERRGEGGSRILAGVDCSGLLYEATDGYTPRNTSSLTTYGKGVAIAGKGATAIAAMLRPLDLIVWPGHVLIAIDGDRVIESRLVCGNPTQGVRIRNAAAALAEIMRTRQPVDAINRGKGEFVVRRWYESAAVDR